MTTIPFTFTTATAPSPILVWSFTTAEATLLECFRDRFPEFSAVLDVDVLEAITEAQCFVSQSAWGECRYKLGVIYLAAHLVFCSTSLPQDGTGELRSVKVGPLSKSFGPTSDESSGYGKSKYGVRYTQMRRSVFAERCL